MNSYFSRLAQRSGLTASSSNGQARHGNPGIAGAATAWGEESIETESSWQYPAHAVENGSDGESKPGAPQINGKAIISSANAINITASIDENDGHPSRESAVIKAAAPHGAEFPETRQTHAKIAAFNDAEENLVAETSPSGLQANKHASILSSPANARKNSNAFVDHPLRKKTSAGELESDTVASRYAGPSERNLSSTTPFTDTLAKPYVAEESLAGRHSMSDSGTNGNHKNTHIEHQASVKRVASNPVQTAPSSIQAQRTASRAPVQISIGKIELEVYAPPARSHQAPAPIAAPAAPPAAPRSSAFNPHRHYLRSR